MEEYLWGVVAAEMPASFEEEALKAQACAARTYTVTLQAVSYTHLDVYKRQSLSCPPSARRATRCWDCPWAVSYTHLGGLRPGQEALHRPGRPVHHHHLRHGPAQAGHRHPSGPGDDQLLPSERYPLGRHPAHGGLALRRIPDEAVLRDHPDRDPGGEMCIRDRAYSTE